MKTVAQFNAVRLFAAAVAIGCLLHWLAAGAEAGCGDYVLVHGLMDAHAQNEGAADATASHAAPANRHAPCHGPQCSKRSVPPVDPSPAPATSQQRHDGSYSAPEFLVLASVSTRMVAAEDRPQSVLRGDPIFRPPRAAAPALA